MSNSLRYSPESSQIHITGSADDACVRVRIVDHGPGISDGDRAVMFDAFQRLDDRTSGGTGLGLAIARSFTEAMNGTLEPSTTPRGGLTMTVALPRSS